MHTTHRADPARRLTDGDSNAGLGFSGSAHEACPQDMKPPHLADPARQVDATRHALPRFLIIAPDMVRPGPVVFDGARKALREPLFSWAAQAAQLSLHDPQLRALAQRSLQQLRTPAPQALPASVDAHDAYFKLCRCAIGESGSQAPEAYLFGLLSALLLFLDEVADSDDLQDYASIGEALVELWARALGAEVAAPPRREPAPMRARTAQPIRRWLRGHHLFAVITQGLIWNLRNFERLPASAEVAAKVECIRLTTRLYRASAAAFRFTADFAPGVYSGIIRPSMSEPHVPAGFSGSMSVDHGHLVATLSGMREPLAALKDVSPEPYAEMVAALGQVYDDHRWVCERFAGSEGPSLRSDHMCSDNAAVNMIDRFKARRVDMLR